VPTRLWRRLRYVCTTGARRRLRDRVLRADGGNRFVLREDLARRYLDGTGIEIGAAFWPLRVPPGVTIRYLDHLSREDLVREYAHFAEVMNLDLAAIPRVDVVDDATRLTTLADASQDFVIANHVLEHTEDPIGALQTLLRVIKPAGILFLTLPDARHTFDSPRPRTSVEHLLRDHNEGPELSRNEHYEEWARYIEGAAEQHVATRVSEFAAEGAKHHFHVWELENFLALLLAVDLPCEIALAQRNGEEFAVILRRS
jgi:predicted SAM-dependent methyltransferase